VGILHRLGMMTQDSPACRGERWMLSVRNRGRAELSNFRVFLHKSGTARAYRRLPCAIIGEHS
jgi:hypothetical protein